MKPRVVMLSDFGIDSGLVASMHGVCAKVDEELRVYDATHLLPAFDINAASYCLQYTVPYWPDGTIFVCVVDPGVGTSRKASVAKLKNGSYIVTPDNGTLTLIDKYFGIEEIREIDETVNRYKGIEDVSVFHGRDLFAYTAAKLASGKISFEEVGEKYSLDKIVRYEIEDPEIEEGRAVGIIKGYDPFGTAETNFLNKDFVKTGFNLGDLLNIKISLDDKTVFEEKVLFDQTFGCVEVGENILFRDLAFYVSLGNNQGNFKNTYGLKDGEKYKIEITK